MIGSSAGGSSSAAKEIAANWNRVITTKRTDTIILLFFFIEISFLFFASLGLKEKGYENVTNNFEILQKNYIFFYLTVCAIVNKVSISTPRPWIV